jgi:hypothetical protein
MKQKGNEIFHDTPPLTIMNYLKIDNTIVYPDYKSSIWGKYQFSIQERVFN